MSDAEMLLVINRWYRLRRQAYGIPEGQELATTADKAAVGRWLERYGLMTVNLAMWDVILKGRKVEGYHPQLRHVGAVLRRDYLPLDKRTVYPDADPEKRFIGQLPPPDRGPATPWLIESKEGQP